MQVVANQELVKNRSRLAVGLYVVSLVILGLGYLRSWNLRETDLDLVENWAPTYGFIILGVVIWAIGLSQLNRWGPRRQQALLTREIKSLDDRHKLYAFVASSLPDYILVGPAGVQVLLLRAQRGTIACEQNRWRTRGAGAAFMRLFGGGSLGNPSVDGVKQIAKVRALLEAEGLKDVPISAVAVFTNPRARLEIRGCAIAATRLDHLKTLIRRASGKGKDVVMNMARIREVQGVFDRRLAAAGRWR
jgi:hypothetical protein